MSRTGVVSAAADLSVDAAVRGATQQLAVAGVASPRTDAEWLLAHVVGQPRTRRHTVRRLTAEQADAYATLVGRRTAREPLQHILGTAPFRYLELAVGPGVFVPRPETELLVDAVLPVLHSRPRPVVVDLCAGSGALALAVAHEVPTARVYAVERAPEALVWLRGNADQRAADGDSPVTVVAADVAAPDLLRTLHATVDVVVSNPPYVPTGTPVDAEVAADPPDAVFAGPEGLDLMPAVVGRAADLLRPGGLVAIEHDEGQHEALPELLARHGDFDEVCDHLDLAGRPRYVTALRRRK